MYCSAVRPACKRLPTCPDRILHLQYQAVHLSVHLISAFTWLHASGLLSFVAVM